MSYIHTYGVEYSDDKKTLVCCPEEATEITILDSVTSIEKGAFWGCSGLTSIVIPDGVTSIGEETFYDCSGLTSIVIPDSVTSIGEWAFSDCSGLISIVIPDSVTSIGDGEGAFYGCSGLKEIRIPKGTRDKFCAMPELKEYENLLVEYKKEGKEKCAM